MVMELIRATSFYKEVFLWVKLFCVNLFRGAGLDSPGLYTDSVSLPFGRNACGVPSPRSLFHR
jgi:hypothetical protein